MTEKNDAASQQPPPRRKRRQMSLLWRILLFLVFLVAAVCCPPSFRFGIRTALVAQAWLHHARLSIGKMEGSLFEPLTFSTVRLTHQTPWGTTTDLEIGSARAVFSWKNLLLRKGTRWWQEFTLDGVTATVDIPADPVKPQHAPSSSPDREQADAKTPMILFPAVLAVQNANVVVRQNGDSFQFENFAFRASELEPNEIRFARIEVRQPWLTTHFLDVTGTVSLQNLRVLLTDVKLQESLTLESASADLVELLRGRLRTEFSLAAFNGTIRGEIKSAGHDEHLNFESTGRFSNISILRLSEFLGEDADGTIKDGKFTFTGSLRNLPKSTLSTRLEATDFRWEKRQWNSLVLGATIVNRRAAIHELQLRQTHNSLSLTGDVAIPPNWHDWWKGDFSFNIAAKIDDLSELSALFGPAFWDIYGKLAVDGSVRGQNSSFNGQLIATGSQLSYRTAPLDELRAAIKLNGNEVEIANAEFVHGNDFLRGRGVVNILGEKRYSGEVKASIANLALYSAFMQPPLVPQAFAGGLVLDWSGDGSAVMHSGAFRARFEKIRPLENATWRPLNVDAEGTYSPENIYFGRLVLADADTSLSAKVVANQRSFTLQELRLTHGKAVWLEGDAQLPLNLWAVWQNPESATWWNFESPCELNLTAHGLSLHEALLLSGREIPVHGEIRGQLTTDGSLADFSLGGQLSLKKGAAATPHGLLKSAEADLSFDQHTATIKGARGELNGLAWSADGNVAIKDIRDPNLALAVRLPKVSFAPSDELRADTALDLRVVGALHAPHVSGEARLLSATLNRSVTLASLLEDGSTGLDAPLLQPLTIAPLADWFLDVNLVGLAPLKLTNTSARIAPELHIAGSAAAPQFSGEIKMSGLTVTEGKTALTIDTGSVLLSQTGVPFVLMRVNGSSSGTQFNGLIFGPITDKKIALDSVNNTLDAGSIASLITRGSASTDLNAPLPEIVVSLDAPAPVPQRDAPMLLHEAAQSPQQSDSFDVALWPESSVITIPPPDSETSAAPQPSPPLPQ